MLNILDTSLKRRERFSKSRNEKLISELNAKDEDALHTAVAEVFGSFFRTHTSLSVGIVEFVYTNVLQRFLNSTPYD